MNNQYPLSELIRQIDEWIAQLQDWELNEVCRRSGNDFFSFMTKRGVFAGWIVNLITEVTGCHPRRLCNLQDANALKLAIQAYEHTIAEIGHDENAGDVGNVRRHAQQIAQQTWRRLYQQ